MMFRLTLPALMVIAVFTSFCEKVFTAEESTAEILQGSMIWAKSAPPDRQNYVLFRKTFNLPSQPQQALLHIFADSRYVLWINGRYVERGPCRFDPKRPEYDTLDVASYLQKGKNVIAVLGHRYFDDTIKTEPQVHPHARAANPPWTSTAGYCGRIMKHAPGLTILLELTNEQGHKTRLSTGPDWLTKAKTGFGPSPWIWGSIPDRIDARSTPRGWTLPQFDDSTWEKAVRVDGSQWGRMHARSIPLLRETEINSLTVLEKPIASKANDAKWIWHREKNYPRQKSPRWSAPEGERFFRLTFDLPQGVTEVIVHATADNEFDCFFNGHKIGENHGTIHSWTNMARMDATKLTQAGRNTLAFRAINGPYGEASDPAGLLVVVDWKAGDKSGRIVSDGKWKSTAKKIEGWEQRNFDDSEWQ
ncbi:MAG: alpha-L-rhamnosidase N-terminal domain-containing protein, partial [Pirellulales bacterium]|nr:alpha-L-rhamnosidase N-terminal domain-containing protein [Pirellulales bacterium]